MNVEKVSIDILVIGAGGAGIRAAIEAKRLGVSVFLLGKEGFKKDDLNRLK